MATRFSELKKTAVNANNTDSVTEKLYVGENLYVSWCVMPMTGDHGTHVFTLQESLDGTNWINSSSTLNGDGGLRVENNILNITKYVRVKCTTAEETASTVDIVINAK